MRREATLQEWGELYQLGVRFKEMKPYRWLGNDEVIAVEFSQEETAYFSIMGNGGYMYGFSMYLGLSGLNCLLGLLWREMLGIEEMYMTAEQECIAMFLSGKEEVPEEQRDVIHELGLRFRGEHSWIYFEKHEKGYFPYILNRDEVLTCTKYLEKLLEALKCYRKESSKLYDLDNQIYVYGCNGGEWTGRFAQMPRDEFWVPQPKLADLEQIRMIKSVNKTKEVWEVDCRPLYEGVSDEKYDKIVLPRQFLIMDHKKDLALKVHLMMPDDGAEAAASKFGDLIIERGRPKKVIVPNILVKYMIDDMCRVGGIELQMGEIPCCENFLENFGAYDNFDEKQLLRGLEELGLDIGRLKEDAMHMSQEEFFENLMGELGGIFGADEWDGYEAGIREYDLRTRKQKVDIVKRFFARPASENEAVYREEKIKSIEADWAYNWKKLLRQSTKEQLFDMAVKMGALVDKGYAKGLLVDIVMSMAVRDGRALSGLLTENESDMMRELVQKLADMEAGWELEDFPYSLDQVLRLLNLGVLDVGYLESDTEEILQLKPIADLMDL